MTGHKTWKQLCEMYTSILEGVTLLWFALAIPFLIFVIVDIRSTPENPILKLGFVLVTAYTGVIGAFLYVMGCREPLPGLHERYVSTRWRQVLGSTIHCVAGDGIGILVGAVIGSIVHVSPYVGVAIEYSLGFLFGWAIFQSLFMRDMAGDSYRRSLVTTFIPELLSMNLLMTAMIPISTIFLANLPGGHDPLGGVFWFIFSMALLGGLGMAYPMNWWLVSRHLKHGMMTVRPKTNNTESMKSPHADMHHTKESLPRKRNISIMIAISFLALASGIGTAWFFGGL